MSFKFWPSFLFLILFSPSVTFACFLGIGCEPAAPTPIEPMRNCFSRLTNTQPVDAKGRVLPHGALRRLVTQCADNLKSSSPLELFVLPRLENGKSLLYVMDEKDGHFRVKKFPIKTHEGAQQVELKGEDYQLQCLSSGGENINAPLVLNLDLKTSGKETDFRVRQQRKDFSPHRQSVEGHEDMGPHITRMILEENVKDLATLESVPRGPAFSDRTLEEVRKYCGEMADQVSRFPSAEKGSEEEKRILSLQAQVLNQSRNALTKPAASSPSPARGSRVGE
jgi:hypothetical protein